jgi:hypothetical protein
MEVSGDSLYVAHSDLSGSETYDKSWISVVNLKSGEVKDYELNHDTLSMTVVNDKLYALDNKRRTIYQYKLEDLTLVNKKEIPEGSQFTYLPNVFNVAQ